MTNIKTLTKINQARTQFLTMNVKKSGVNKYQGFNYFELQDIIPAKTQICNDLNIADYLDMQDPQIARLHIYDLDQDDTQQPVTFSLNMPIPSTQQQTTKQIQEQGALQTYVHRYLLLQFLDIIESDGIDRLHSLNDKTTKPNKSRVRPHKTLNKRSNSNSNTTTPTATTEDTSKNKSSTENKTEVDKTKQQQQQQVKPESKLDENGIWKRKEDIPTHINELPQKTQRTLNTVKQILIARGDKLTCPNYIKELKRMLKAKEVDTITEMQSEHFLLKRSEMENGTE